MKSLHDLTSILVRDEARKLSIDDVERDILTLTRRALDEGDRFLTVTLADFGKQILYALEEGHLNKATLTGFRARRRGSLIPALLQGWTRHIFSDEGSVLPNPSVAHLRSLRFICQVNSKVRCEPSPEQERAAELGFIETEESLRNVHIPDDALSVYRDVARLVINDVARDAYDEETFKDSLLMQNGPGAVSQKGLHGSDKYDALHQSWDRALNEVFPWERYANSSYLAARLVALSNCLDESLPDDPYDEIVKEEERYGRIVFVPKTCKGPRTICIEPAARQFVQQGIKNYLYDRIAASSLTKNSISFTDQEIHQYAAQKASLDGKRATLDLSEASDRVSLEHVHYLLESHPILYKCVMACRTTKVVMPSGIRLRLNKFASMGSALCFPVEALVFYCIIQTQLHREAGIRPTPLTIQSFSQRINVYGDDLIVPSDAMDGIVSLLTTFGLKVSRTKSFGKSRFRESCGSEWYAGRDVRPLYLRVNPMTRYAGPEQLTSFFAFVHSLYARGNEEVVAELRSAYESGLFFRGLPKRFIMLPEVPVSCGEIGWPTFFPVKTEELRYDEARQTSYLPVWRPTKAKRESIQGYGALFRFFIEKNIANESADACSERNWRFESDRLAPVRLRRGRLYVNSLKA